MQFSSFRISNAFLPAETIILSCFWVVFWPELPKNVVKFVWPVMTCKMMHLICYCFYWSTGQKTDFLAHYESFLCMLSYTLWVMPQNFVNWETLLRYSSVAGFITTGYVVVKFKVFLLIPHPWHGPMKLLYSPKSCSILFEIIRSSTNKTNTASKILQNFEFWLRCNAEVYSFGSFWGPIYFQKTKNIAKNQNFCQNCLQTYILRNIK